MSSWIVPVSAYLLEGLLVTLLISTVSIIIATIVGIFIAGLSRSNSRLIRFVSRSYVEIFRGVPSLMVLLFVFFALPQVGLKTGPFSASVIGLGFWAGANVSEIFRGALNSISNHQEQAARALGMSHSQAILFVVLPQAVRTALPAYVGQLTVLVQASALTSVVGVSDLLGAARHMIERLAYLNSSGIIAVQIYLGVLLVFFAICYPLTLLASALETRLRR